jgi:hypothetical protein
MSATDAAWVLELGPSSSCSVAPASSPLTLDAARARLGQGPVDWAVEVGYGIARTLQAEVPELAADDRSLQTLRMGTESATLRVLVMLTDPGAGEPITDEALEGDRDFVRRDVALDKVLRGIRLSHAVLVKVLMDGCRALVAADQQPLRMQALTDTLFDFVDGFCSRMTEEYLAERDRWVAGAEARRREMVQAILAGHSPDADAASSALGYPLHGTHLAATAWLESPSWAAADLSRLPQIVTGLLRRRGCVATLVVPTAGAALWAWGWLAAPQPIAEDPVEPRQAAVRIALGTPRPGLEGFRGSHRDALLAEEVIRLAPAGHLTVADHQEVALVALLGRDLPALREFVNDELGPLACDTVQAGQLRATLRQYLRDERSPAAAAAQLHVARNTVSYRVNRARELLGHDIAKRRAELLAALEATHLLGAAVLRDPADPGVTAAE